MIIGAHLLLYSDDPAADRAFFRDVLGFASVDAGRGWLIFALPPAEVAVHPADDAAGNASDLARTDLYLMCDDLEATIASLAAREIVCGPVSRERWGIRTTVRLPGGGALGLYQPLHPVAIGLT
jgi:hypothetical protein